MSSGVALFVSTTAIHAADDGISLSTVQCSTPAPIDGVVYIVQGSSRRKDLHRVRHIEGVCEKIHKGTVRVGFWVGNCASYRSADAYTGWNSGVPVVRGRSTSPTSIIADEPEFLFRF